MRQPPPLAQLPRFPVVGGVGLLAVAISLAYWSKRVDVSPLMEDHQIRQGQVWRLATSALPHGDPLHLAFNLMWLWVLGSLVEETFGHVRTFLLVVLLAVGSGAAEHAFLHGGIGLSGVGYGLFGFLWVLSHRDERFRGAVDQQTVGMFVGWFFLCIVLTAAGAWKVANIAHGAGAVLGALLGLTVAPGRLRPAYGALLVLLAAGIGAAEYARPYVNFTVERAYERAQLGYDALEAERNEEAVGHYRAAVRRAGAEADSTWWYNLGLAQQRLEQYDAAKDAFERAARMDPSDEDYQSALKSIDILRHLDRTSKALGNVSEAFKSRSQSRPAERGTGEVGDEPPTPAPDDGN